MSTSLPPKLPTARQRRRWQSVERARELFERNAHKAAKTVINAAANGDLGSAKWMLTHTAVTNEAGEELRPIASGIDKAVSTQLAPDNTPRIMIGVALGADFARLGSPTSQADRPLPIVDVSQVVTERK